MNKIESIRYIKQDTNIYIDLKNDWDCFNLPKEAENLRDDVLSFLESKGWIISTDEWTDNIYKYEYPWSKVGYNPKSKLRFSFKFDKNIIEINVFQTVFPADRKAENGRFSFGQYEVMTYKMQQYFKLLAKQVSRFLKVTLTKIDASELAEKSIIKNNNDSWHRTNVNCLEEIDECKHSNNALDKNKKLLKNGQVKYFYGYNGRLNRGKIYYNISNMWWVLVDKFNYSNIACFNLFDYNGEPLKNPKRVRSILESKLKESIKIMDFQRAEKFKKLLNPLEEKKYRIWSIKHGSWWGSNNSGYTNSETNAGIYLESEIKESYYNNGLDTKLIEI